MREHWGSFGRYLRNPPPEHVMDGASVGFGQEGWRPFRGPLKETSARQAEVIVKGFYDWMADPSIGAIEFDPVKTWKTHTARKSRTKDGVDRLLSREHLAYVHEAIESMPGETTERMRERARAKWICCLALNTGLRASEIARASSSMLRWGSEPGTRILRIRRKGDIESDLPLLDEVVDGYRDYLAVYGLEVSAHLDLPLVMPTRVSERSLAMGSVKHLSRPHIWKVMRDVLTAGADVAAARGDTAAQEVLLLASTHWLRHTFANELLDSGADIRAVRDLLDHGDISTTNTYLHKAQAKLRGEINKLARRSRAQ
jgi:site-specific recombinase XerD